MPKNLARRSQRNRAKSSRQELAAILRTSTEFIAAVREDKQNYYSSFEIPKSNGESRTIEPPKIDLKVTQRNGLEYLYKVFRIPTWLHGGLPNRSVLTHAEAHVGHRLVATLDVRGFYPSTNMELVREVLAQAGFAEQALDDFVDLVTLNGALPQGAPTSSLLANLAFVPADVALRKVCRRHDLNHTRFSDDIAISGDVDFQRFRGLLLQIIANAGYIVADEKTRFMTKGQRQVVTGLVVNDRLRPTKEFIGHLKHDLRICLEMGPRVLATAEGVSVKTIKARLNGRVAHVARCDADIGKKLKGLLYGIDWQRPPAVSTT